MGYVSSLECNHGDGKSPKDRGVGPSKWASFGLKTGGVFLTTYVTYVRARDDAPRVPPQFQQTTYLS